MTDLSAQKRLAAEELGVGENRVWLDPEEQAELAEAITREDVRELIDQGVVRAKAAQGNSRGRARERQDKRAYGHQTGPGTRKGESGGRQSEKDGWKRTARAQRQTLRELRDDGVVTPAQYRELYDKARGGEFPDVRRMLNFAEEEYAVHIDRSEY